MAKYKESGDVLDLPEAPWVKSYHRDAEHWNERRVNNIKQGDEKKVENEQAREFRNKYTKENPDSEVVRLYHEIKRREVFPFEPVAREQSFSEKKQKYAFTLTEAQQKTYQDMQNKRMEEEYEEVVSTKEYRAANGEGKREMLKEARSKAKLDVKKQIKKDYLEGHKLKKVK